MRLVLSGSWLKKDGFYEAKIEGVHIIKLEDLEGLEGIHFLVLSYDLTSYTLGVHIKESGLPKLLAIKLDRFERINTPSYIDANLTFISSSLSDKDFMDRVRTTKDFIRDGFIYQLNLTNRFDFSLERGKPFDLFYQFIQRQAVPYGFFLDLGEFFIVSGSMELFLERVGKRLLSKPIKGTSNLEESLRRSQKDKSENLMITDMVRNDFGRIARPGSVRVTELFKITQYSTLFQMHSSVECRTDKILLDVIRATFPPASVTGAPKRKAVEIINMLEPHERGFYCGCAGLFFDNFNFILSVLIRTAIGKGKVLSYYAGCGIVWDSDPKRELEELYTKTKAFYDFRIL
ncbi:MAG: chorismate-binding protein [Aquificaceae bacterium]